MGFLNFSQAFRKLLGSLEQEEKRLDWLADLFERRVFLWDAHSKGYEDVRDSTKLKKASSVDNMRAYFRNLAGSADNDEKAFAIAVGVSRRMAYVSDAINYSVPEFWEAPDEVFTKWRGDCDDYALLILKGWELVGIPASRRFVWVGDVFNPNGTYGGLHATPLYFPEREPQPYILEGSFYPEKSWQDWQDGLGLWENKRYGNCLFVFNEKMAYDGAHKYLRGAKAQWLPEPSK